VNKLTRVPESETYRSRLSNLNLRSADRVFDVLTVALISPPRAYRFKSNIMFVEKIR